MLFFIVNSPALRESKLFQPYRTSEARDAVAVVGWGCGSVFVYVCVSDSCHSLRAEQTWLFMALIDALTGWLTNSGARHASKNGKKKWRHVKHYEENKGLQWNRDTRKYSDYLTH